MTAETTVKTKRYTFWAAILVLALVVLPLTIRSFFHKSLPVRVANPTYEDLVTAVSTNGKVEPIHNFEAHAPAPGVVSNVSVHEGDTVAPGTLLLSMDDSAALARVATARSAVATAQSSSQDIKAGGTQEERINLAGEISSAQLQVQQAQRDLAALKQLQTKGAASASEVEATEERLNTAQSRLHTLQQRDTSRFTSLDHSRSQAQLAESSAALHEAEKALQQAVVRAPFHGTVYSLPVKQYDFLSTGDPLLRMADLSQMQVRAYFDEPEIGKLTLNQPVVITWDALPGRTWHGHIVHTPSTIIPYGTRNVGECLIAVDDAKGDLLPSTNVNVRVTTSQKTHVLTVPREALRTQGAQNYVFRIIDGKLVRTPVRVGGANLTLVEIEGGLTPNDTVALNAITSADLDAGMSVQPAK